MVASAPKITLSLFHPKFWLTWLGLGIIYVIVQLPTPWIWAVGSKLGHAIKPLIKRRIHIAHTNLRLCYPNKSEDEISALLNNNIEAQGRGILEMGMGWWWSDKRIREVGEIEGIEYVESFYQQGKGVMAITIHNINLEVSNRVVGQHIPAINFYRPHNNALLEYMQFHGRLRSNKHSISKRNTRRLMSLLKTPNLALYLPDHDYGPVRAEFVPFCGNTLAATTTATANIIRRTECGVVLLAPIRTPNGYKIKILPAPEHYPTGDDQEDCTIINKAIADLINLCPEQYLWAHRRFKTRPPEAPETLY